MICRKCGKEIKDTAKFCPYCGADNKGETSRPVEAPKPAEAADTPAMPKPAEAADTPAMPKPVEAADIPAAPKPVNPSAAEKGNRSRLPILAAGLLAVAVLAASFILLRGKGTEEGPMEESQVQKKTSVMNEVKVDESAADESAENDPLGNDYAGDGVKKVIAAEDEEKVSEEETTSIALETSNDMGDRTDIDAEKEREKIVVLYREIQDHLEEYIREEKGGVIRYSSLDGRYEKVVKKSSGSGENKEYFFENGKLRFAYYYNGNMEKRFYFLDDKMFRYIDPQKNVHDLALEMAEWSKLEQNVLDEAERCRKPHSYEVVLKDCTWEEAWAEARRMGGCLVRFDTVEEFDEVMGRIGSANIKNKLWIGGRRAAGSNVYHWLNEDGTYQTGVINGEAYAGLWMKNEPSFRDQGVEEEYLNLFYYEKEGRWVLNDVPNDILAVVSGYAGTVGFIVEFE